MIRFSAFLWLIDALTGHNGWRHGGNIGPNTKIIRLDNHHQVRAARGVFAVGFSNAQPLSSAEANETAFLALSRSGSETAPDGTRRDFSNQEFNQIGALILRAIDAIALHSDRDASVKARLCSKIAVLCPRFPIYGA